MAAIVVSTPNSVIQSMNNLPPGKNGCRNALPPRGVQISVAVRHCRLWLAAGLLPGAFILSRQPVYQAF